jgi:hypothetical protein
MDDVVRMAEALSARTCELCGNSSSRGGGGTKFDDTVDTKNRNGWYKTLCNTCAEKQGYPLTEDEDD